MSPKLSKEQDRRIELKRYINFLKKTISEVAWGMRHKNMDRELAILTLEESLDDPRFK